MKLDEYVRETLLAILKGVLDAQSDEVAGQWVGRAGQGSSDLKTHADGEGNTVTMVAFDLATTNEGSAGGGISVVPFIQAKGETKGSQANRIQFQVPISVPKPDAQGAQEARRARESQQAIEAAGPKDWMTV